MELTIITPCSRSLNLELMAKSIPDGIRWVVVFDAVEIPKNITLPDNAEYYCMAGGVFGYSQSNYALQQVKDGYIYFLDDDTVLHPDLIPTISKVLKYTNADFIHFNQQGPQGQPRIGGGAVQVGKIDKGCFVASRKLIADSIFIQQYEADGLFAIELHERAKNSIWLDESLSYYNALRPEHPDIPREWIGTYYPTRYSVIIPTMWKCISDLKYMVDLYTKAPLIAEIIIIDNDKKAAIELQSYKVRVIGTGVNIFVNPAWNLGVGEARHEKIIIANDDIRIPEFAELLTAIDYRLKPGDIIGPNVNCFAKFGLKLGAITFKKEVNDQGYGYGCFMVMHKNDYTPVPDELKVWCGDNIQSAMLNNLSFNGVQVITQMQTTSKTLDLSVNRKVEFPFFKKWWDANFATPKTIVLVFKSGGDFTILDVILLVHHLRKNSKPETKIICLSDQTTTVRKMIDFEIHPLPNPNWKGWWSKMNIFNPQLADLRPFLFMDLDTAIVNDFDTFKIPIRFADSFIGVNDFYQSGLLQSCLMYIPKESVKLTKIWDTWISFPEKWMSKFRGDQDFIRSVAAPDTFFQTFTDVIQSFKPVKQNTWRISLTKTNTIICFHGHPRILEASKTVTWVDKYVNECTKISNDV